MPLSSVGCCSQQTSCQEHSEEVDKEIQGLVTRAFQGTQGYGDVVCLSINDHCWHVLGSPRSSELRFAVLCSDFSEPQPLCGPLCLPSTKMAQSSAPVYTKYSEAQHVTLTYPTANGSSYRLPRNGISQTRCHKGDLHSRLASNTQSHLIFS